MVFGRRTITNERVLRTLSSLLKLREADLETDPDNKKDPSNKSFFSADTIYRFGTRKTKFIARKRIPIKAFKKMLEMSMETLSPFGSNRPRYFATRRDLEEANLRGYIESTEVIDTRRPKFPVIRVGYRIKDDKIEEIKRLLFH